MHTGRLMYVRPVSVTQTVFLVRANLPTRDAWVRAIKHDGFTLELASSFDPATADGYVPCTHVAAEAGFEYLMATADDYLVEQDLTKVREHLDGRDTAISFVTRSSAADLNAATIAAAVLATVADGLFWSDEAGEFLDDPLALARDLDVERVPAATPPAAPRSVATDLATRIVFRGKAMTTLETIEAVPRRFTVKVGLTGSEARILAVWEHPVGSPTVHRVRMGNSMCELDPKGAPSTARPIATLVMELGVTETATRELLAAGPAAVAPLCEVVSDRRRPMMVRRMAIVILGQLRDRGAARALEALAKHADLGDVAREALGKLE